MIFKSLILGVNHPLTILPGSVAALFSTLLWFAVGDCGGLPQVRVIDHASCHRDCRRRSEPRRLLVVFVSIPSSRRRRRSRSSSNRCRQEPTPRPRSDRAARPPARSPCPRPTPASPSPSRCHKFQPVTVPVQVIRNPGDFASPPRPSSIPIRCSRNCSRPARRRRRASRCGRRSRSRPSRGAAPRRLAVPDPPRRPPTPLIARTAPAACGL